MEHRAGGFGTAPAPAESGSSVIVAGVFDDLAVVGERAGGFERDRALELAHRPQGLGDGAGQSRVPGGRIHALGQLAAQSHDVGRARPRHHQARSCELRVVLDHLGHRSGVGQGSAEGSGLNATINACASLCSSRADRSLIFNYRMLVDGLVVAAAVRNTLQAQDSRRSVPCAWP